MISLKLISLAPSRRLVLALFVGTFLLFFPSLSIAQSDQDKAGARSMAEQGADAYDAGNYEESIDFFQRAEHLYPALPHQLYIARSLSKLGKLVEAKEVYIIIGRALLDDGAPTAFVNAKEAASRELEELEPRISSLQIIVEGEEADTAVVTLDGQAMDSAYLGVPRPINPGHYELLAESAWGSSESVSVEIAEGEQKQITLPIQTKTGETPAAEEAAQEEEVEKEKSTSEPARDRGSKRTAAWVVTGTGAASLASGAALGIFHFTVQSDADQLFKRCNDSDAACSSDEQKEIDRKDKTAARLGTASIITLSVGAASLATGIVMLVLGKKKAKTAQGFSLQPYASFNHLGLSGRF